MPKSKKEIHDLLSPGIANKRIARRKVGLAAAKAKLEKKQENLPAKVNNFLVNKPLFGPHKIKKKPVEVKQRKISPMEGKPVVSSSSVPKVATKKDFIHKPVVKLPVDPTAGAIEPTTKKVRPSRTKRDSSAK